MELPYWFFWGVIIPIQAVNTIVMILYEMMYRDK